MQPFSCKIKNYLCFTNFFLLFCCKNVTFDIKILNRKKDIKTLDYLWQIKCNNSMNSKRITLNLFVTTRVLQHKTMKKRIYSFSFQYRSLTIFLFLKSVGFNTQNSFRFLHLKISLYALHFILKHTYNKNSSWVILCPNWMHKCFNDSKISVVS